jgi:hypothetical protein
MHTTPQSFNLIGSEESNAALQLTIAEARAHLQNPNRKLVGGKAVRHVAVEFAINSPEGSGRNDEPVYRAIRDVLGIDADGELLPIGPLQGAQLDTAMRTALFGVGA